MDRSEKIPVETAEFAAYLRGLKERTDRSYGSLATQLHLGASTLHRYCHGHAVPVDYAPVERLARVCGATPAERVELHRRWLVALSARTSPPGPAPEVEPRVEPELKPTSDTGGRPIADTANAGTTNAGTTNAGTTNGASTSGGGAVRTDSDAASGTEAGGPADEDPAPPPPAATAPPLSAPRASRLRRRQVVAAALAVVTVLGGAVVVAASLGNDGSRLGEGRPSATTPAPSGPADPAAPSTGATSPSPKTSAKPSGRVAPPSDSGGGAKTGDPSGGQRSAPPKSPANSLVWSANSHVWALECGHVYLVNRGPGAVPPPPVAQDARGWATALGAVHGGSSITRATLRPASNAGPVVVQELFVRVVGRRAPLDWNAYDMSNGCGGSLTPAKYTVDLDAGRPVARPVDGAGETGPIRAPRLPYQVTSGDPLVLEVEASTEGCDCDWYLEVRWTAGDRTGVTRIDDGGRPFRTSATTPGSAYGHDYATGSWVAP